MYPGMKDINYIIYPYTAVIYLPVRFIHMIRSKRPRDILNEIRWRFDLNKCRVHYIHRGVPGDVMTIEGSAIEKIERSFMILKGDPQEVYIPLHRILRIEYDGRPVYTKLS